MPKKLSQTSDFKGFQAPRYTQVPDELFDQLLTELTGAELKVLLYIIRRTFGFKKDSDNISLSQMLRGIQKKDGEFLDHGVGLSKKALLQAINNLEVKNIIITERRRSLEKGDEPTAYRLNVISSPEVEKSTPPVGEKVHQGGGEENTPRPWSKKYTTQQTESQDTDIQYDVVADMLRQFGISKTIAGKMARTYPQDYIIQKLDMAQWLVETHSPLIAKNPAGYLRRAIEEDYQAPAKYKSRNEGKATAEERREAIDIQEQEMRDVEAEFLRAREAAQQKLLDQYPPQHVHGSQFTTETVWRLVLEQLKGEVTTTNFHTWLKGTSLISCDGRTALVVAPTVFQAEWVQKRFDPIIKKALTSVLGYSVSSQYTAITQVLSMNDSGELEHLRAIE